MTYFGQKLLKAVRPNTKLGKSVQLAIVTRWYSSQEEFEREMASRRRVGGRKRQ